MSAEVRAGWSNAQRWRALKAWSPVIAEIEEVGRNDPAFRVFENRFDQIAARCFDAMGGQKPTQVLGITSALAGEGTTTIAIGMSAAAARNLGRDVLLVETNMRTPVLASDLRVEPLPGLSEYLDHHADLEQIIRRTRGPNAWLLPAGSITSNAGPLLRSNRLKELFGVLRGLFAAVVIDIPPMLTSSEGPLLAQLTDGLVITCRAGSTHSQDIERAIEMAGKADIRGLVLNRTRRWVPRWVSRIAGMSRSTLD